MLGAARIERVGHQAGIVGAGKCDAVARERHHVELGVLHDLEHALVLENGLQQIERVAQGNLRDRIAAVGGELDITSAPGHGTTIRGSVPLERAESELATTSSVQPS